MSTNIGAPVAPGNFAANSAIDGPPQPIQPPQPTTRKPKLQVCYEELDRRMVELDEVQSNFRTVRSCYEFLVNNPGAALPENMPVTSVLQIGSMAIPIDAPAGQELIRQVGLVAAQLSTRIMQLWEEMLQITQAGVDTNRAAAAGKTVAQPPPMPIPQ